MSGDSVTTGAIRIAETAAMTEATIQMPVKTLSTDMPTIDAPLGFSQAARIACPYFETLKKTNSAAVMTTEITTATIFALVTKERRPD